MTKFYPVSSLSATDIGRRIKSDAGYGLVYDEYREAPIYEVDVDGIILGVDTWDPSGAGMVRVFFRTEGPDYYDTAQIDLWPDMDIEVSDV